MESITDKELSDEFYRARTSALFMLGEDSFRSKVAEYKPILKQLCDKKQVSESEAISDVIKDIEDRGSDSLLALAIFAEIIDPTL